jgi:hypothetical protein
MRNHTPYTWLVLAVITLAASSCQLFAQAKPPDPANATYAIEGRSITLAQGSAEQPAAPGSATKSVTRLSDKQAAGDVTGNGKPALAVVLIYTPGGSGTFYYVSVLLNEGGENGTATNAILLGDRIAVEQVSINDRQIVVDYLTRPNGAALATPPSVKTSKKLVAKDRSLLETP